MCKHNSIHTVCIWVPDYTLCGVRGMLVYRYISREACLYESSYLQCHLDTGQCSYTSLLDASILYTRGKYRYLRHQLLHCTAASIPVSRVNGGGTMWTVHKEEFVQICWGDTNHDANSLNIHAICRITQTLC